MLADFEYMDWIGIHLYSRDSQFGRVVRIFIAISCVRRTAEMTGWSKEVGVNYEYV